MQERPCQLCFDIVAVGVLRFESIVENPSALFSMLGLGSVEESLCIQAQCLRLMVERAAPPPEAPAEYQGGTGNRLRPSVPIMALLHRAPRVV